MASNKEKILALLHVIPRYAEELRKITGLGRTSVASCITRLRNDGWTIGVLRMSAGNPLYSLIKGPHTLAERYVCPYCKWTVNINTTMTDHAKDCTLRQALHETYNR